MAAGPRAGLQRAETGWLAWQPHIKIDMKFHPTVLVGPPIPLHSDGDRKIYCTSETLWDNMQGFGNYSTLIATVPEIIRTGMPLQLYKYRKAGDDEISLKYLRQLIVLDTAYISNFKDFNDPFEGMFKITLANKTDYRKKVLSDLRNNTVSSRKQRREEARLQTRNRKVGPEMHERVDSMLEKNLGVLCMSTNPRSVLMWSHYASEHRGLLLEYDTLKEPFFHLGDHVKYSTVFPSICLPSKDENIPFLRKSIEWQYEEEFRIVTRVTRCGVELQSACLTGVILGARCSSEFEKNVRKLLDERKAAGKPSPILKRAKISKSQYSINIETC